MKRSRSALSGLLCTSLLLPSVPVQAQFAPAVEARHGASPTHLEAFAVRLRHFPSLMTRRPTAQQWRETAVLIRLPEESSFSFVHQTLGPIRLDVGAGRSYPKNLFVAYTQPFSLFRDGMELEGELKWIRGRIYLRLGQRWIRTKAEYPEPSAFQWDAVPFDSLLSGELLFGNPALLSWSKLDPDYSVFRHGARALPEEFEAVVEMKHLVDTRYTDEEVSDSAGFLKQTDLIERFGERRLTPSTVAQYLHHLMVIAHSDVGHGDLFVQSMDHLGRFFKIFEAEHNGNSTQSSQISRLEDRAAYWFTFAMKRRMGYDQIAIDFLAKPQIAKRIKRVIDNKAVVWTSNGIGERHLFDETRWSPDVRTKEALFEEARQFGAEATEYSYIADLGFAGNASRVFNNILANKNTVKVVLVKEEAVPQMKAWMARQTDSAWRPELIEIGGRHYLCLLDVVSPMHPGSILIAGPSSIREASRYAQSFYTQPVAHPIDEKTGELIRQEAEIAGHGDLIQLLVSQRRDAIRVLREGVPIRHVQTDDLPDLRTGHLLSYLVKTGQTPLAATVTPQRIEITAALEPLVVALKADRRATVQLAKDGPKLTVLAVDLENGVLLLHDEHDQILIFPYAAMQKAFVQRLEQNVRPLMRSAEAMTAPHQATEQRDLLFEAMKRFQEEVYEPFKVMLQIDGAEDPMPLLKIEMNEGGALFDIDGDLVFTEHSQFQADAKDGGPGVTLTNSKGEERSFYHNVVMAIYFRHFNTNNFTPDPLAWYAAFDERNKEAYFEFLNDAWTRKPIWGIARALHFFFMNKVSWARAWQWGLYRSPAELAALRRVAETKVADVLESLSDATWVERALATELLVAEELPPPVESKKGRIKINKMAQNKASFFARLALSNYVITDFKPSAFDEALTTGKLLDRDGREVDWAVSERLNRTVRSRIRAVRGVEVPSSEFAQVKYVDDYNKWVDTANAVFRERLLPGIEPLERQSNDQIRAVAAVQYARESGLLRDGLPSFEAAMLRIRDGKGTRNDVDLLRWFRPAAAGEKAELIYDWSTADPGETVELEGAEAGVPLKGVVRSARLTDAKLIKALPVVKPESHEHGWLPPTENAEFDSVLEIGEELVARLVGRTQFKFMSIVALFFAAGAPVSAATAFKSLAAEMIAEMPLMGIDALLLSSAEAGIEKAALEMGFTRRDDNVLIYRRRHTQTAA